MSPKIVETLSQIQISFDFGVDFSKDEIINGFSPFQDFLKNFSSVSFVLLENGTVAYDSAGSISDAIDHLTGFLLEQSSKYTVYTIKVEADKASEGVLFFYSYENFTSIFSKDLKRDIKLLSSITSCFDEVYIHDGLKKVVFEMVEKNKYSPDNIFHRYNFEERVGLNPGLVYEIGKELNFYDKDNYVMKLFLYMCMVIFSNKNIKDNTVYHFVFEGLKKSSIEIDFSSKIDVVYDDVFELFSWVFCDGSSVAKVSIIRNVVSSNHVHKINLLFSSDIVFIIESNFQLYHQDNIKQYFELKNKVIDFIFSIGNKVSDAYDSYFTANKLSLVAVLSYIVTLFIVRGVAQNQVESNAIFVCALSLIYFAVCFVYALLVKSELDSKVSFYKKQKDELRSRYDNMLSKLELDSIFSSNTFESAISKSEKAKFHIIVFSILGVLCVSTIAIMLFIVSYPSQ